MDAGIVQNFLAFRDPQEAGTLLKGLGAKFRHLLDLGAGGKTDDFHPESYAAAWDLLKFCGYTPKDVPQNLKELDARMEQLGIEKLAQSCGVGVPTLLDIAKELQKPGRDPRDELPKTILRMDVLVLKDLQ